MTILTSPLETEGCKADARLVDGIAVVRILGNAESDALEPLDGFMTRLHDAVCMAKLPAVRVEIKSLAFMSSSCLRCFVRWLLRLEDLEPKDRYAVTFVPNPDSHWQKRSLRALQSLAPALVVVE